MILMPTVWCLLADLSFLDPFPSEEPVSSVGSVLSSQILGLGFHSSLWLSHWVLCWTVVSISFSLITGLASSLIGSCLWKNEVGSLIHPTFQPCMYASIHFRFFLCTHCVHSIHLSICPSICPSIHLSLEMQVWALPIILGVVSRWDFIIKLALHHLLFCVFLQQIKQLKKKKNMSQQSLRFCS